MTPFKTTPEQRVRSAAIAVEMSEAELPDEFVAEWLDLAAADQGAFELGELWSTETDDTERSEIVIAIQGLVDEAAELPSRVQRKPKLPFDELEDVADAVINHKNRLREIIDRDHGGVTEAAQKIGMTQPSLSRFLSSASMPRRTTLFRIARGLGLPEKTVVTDWVR